MYNGCGPRTSKESERANEDIYDDFKLKIKLWTFDVYKKYISA